ncbi:MAG: M48 family metallopeptidase [Gemmatimonadaceae bacterium]|nr:M48 family metallopeptidase [Gemmatimonadaceae bacterium]
MLTSLPRLVVRRVVPLLVPVLLAGCLASTQQEVQMGQSYAAQLNRQLPLITDPEVQRYITVLGDSLASVADDRNLDWHFYVVDSPEINAFAVPGGFIYVNRGLIERSATMSELAGVLGHEIGHVTNRHSMKQMRKGQVANIGVTAGCIVFPNACRTPGADVLINAGGALAFSKFSRDDERQADEVGVKVMVRAGIDPNGIPAMFRTLDAERKNRPGALEGFFASHPMPADRVDDTQQMIRAVDPAIHAAIPL